jgi:radical SAM protein with 4Fe4S-binding SPASM domain
MSKPSETRHLNFCSDALSFLKTVTWCKLMNSIKLTLSYLYSAATKQPWVNGLPTTATIEPTTLCNLKCPECPSGNGQLRRRKGNMEMKVYDHSIDQIKKTTLWLLLYFQGEPFLHPELFQMIEKARRNNLYTILSTNGHFLNATNCERIIQYGLNRIIISLDGTKEETYSRYRKNGDFHKVTEGIKQLAKAKKSMKARTPLIILQFLVFRHNQDQVKSIKKLGKSLGADSVQVKSAQIYNFREKTEKIPTKTRHSRYSFKGNNEPKLKSELKNKCRRLWYTTVITADGEIVPCCFDKQADYTMGNIMQNPFQKTWKNEAYNNFRKKVLTNRRAISICKNCTE